MTNNHLRLVVDNENELGVYLDQARRRRETLNKLLLYVEGMFAGHVLYTALETIQRFLSGL